MIRWSVKHWVTVFVGVLALLALGWVAFSGLNVSLLPDIEMPVVTVITVYPGASPYEVEEYVTRKIEDAVSLCDNIDNIKSISAESLSVVTVEFQWGTDMDYAQFDVKEKIDRIREKLPDDIEEPYLVRLSVSSLMPIAFMALSGDVNEGYLRWLADEVASKKIVELPGVASVSVAGGLKREIHVTLRDKDMAKLGVPITSVISAIRFNNLSYPAGNLIFGARRYRVRTYSEVTSMEDLKLIPVGAYSGKVVRLSDISDIYEGYKERTSYARINDKPTVFLLVYRQSGANIVRTCKVVRDNIPEVEKLLPPGVSLSMVFGFDERINEIINNLKSEAIEGSILAILIILLFLVSVRSTLVVAISIPLSVIATFTALYFMGLSFNMVTIGGLALAIGRIVDDSIVVIEAITRHFAQGKSPVQAAIDGTEEVWSAIAASTLTTIAVFVPIFFLPGLARQFFKGFSVVMIVGLLASLFVAALVVPPLATFTLGLGKKSLEERENVITKSIKWLQEVYKGFLRGALKVRGLVLLIAFVIFLASLYGLKNIGKDFLPSTDMPIVMLSLFTPPGTSLETTFQKALEVERELYKTIKEEGASYEFLFTIAGAEGESRGLMLMLGGITGSDEYARVEAKLMKKDRRKVRTIVRKLRERLKDYPDITVDFTDPLKAITGQANIKPVEVVLKGSDLDTLWKIANNLKKRISEIPGVYDVDLSWKRGAPELRLKVNRERAAIYGFSAMEIAYAIQALTDGVTVTKYKKRGHEYDIRVKFRKPRSERELNGFYLVSSLTHKSLPLRAITDLKVDTSPSVIEREDRMRIIRITANKDPKVSLTSILSEIKSIIDAEGLPIGYTYEFKGEEKQRRETFSGLGAALIFGIILIYAILASQFNSLTLPIILMMSIPLELIGAYLGLVTFNQTLNMMSMMGVLMVTGIVVSNAVLLIDYTDQLRAKGIPREEALLQAGSVRLKPILMTTLSTIFSMIPLALGLREGGELFRPLAAVVIGGLTTSTLLTLLVVPAFYTYMDDLERVILKRSRFQELPTSSEGE